MNKINILPEINVTGRGQEYHGKWYKVYWVPSHPNANKNGHIEEQRYLGAKALGKPLPKGTVVHHVNGEFRGGELVVCEDNTYHKFLHVRQRAYEATGDAKKRKCPFCKEWDDIKNMKHQKSGKRFVGESYYHSKCQYEYQIAWKLRRNN